MDTIEKLREYRKQFEKITYENNKDKINEKITCDCGCVVARQGLAQHYKTQKHQALLRQAKIRPSPHLPADSTHPYF